MPIDIPEIIMRIITSARMVTDEYADEVNRITRDMVATLLAMYGISPKKFPKPPIIAREEYFAPIDVISFCVGIEKISFAFEDAAIIGLLPIYIALTNTIKAPIHVSQSHAGMLHKPPYVSQSHAGMLHKPPYVSQTGMPTKLPIYVGQSGLICVT